MHIQIHTRSNFCVLQIHSLYASHAFFTWAKKPRWALRSALSSYLKEKKLSKEKDKKIKKVVKNVAVAKERQEKKQEDQRVTKETNEPWPPMWGARKSPGN